MKTLAFLFVASLIFLFVGLLASDGQSPPPSPALSIPSSPAPKPRPPGSANQKSKPLPPPAAEKSELADALKADDLCRASIILGKLPSQSSPPPAEIRGVLSAFGAPASLQEMFSDKGPIYGPKEPEKRFSTPFLNLMYALRLAGLFSFGGVATTTPYEKAALTILEELEAEDPANGAYPYFELVILGREDIPMDKLMATAGRIAHASRFDTMLTAQLAELESSRWESATHYFLLNWLSARVQRISYYAALDALNSLTSERGGVELRDQVGKLLQQEGQRATQRHQFHGFDTEAYEYGLILTTAEDEPTAAELSDQIAGSQWQYGPYLPRDKTCDRAPFDHYYEEMRGHP